MKCKHSNVLTRKVLLVISVCATFMFILMQQQYSVGDNHSYRKTVVKTNAQVWPVKSSRIGKHISIIEQSIE